MKTIEDLVGKFETERIFLYQSRPPEEISREQFRQDDGFQQFDRYDINRYTYLRKDLTVSSIRGSIVDDLIKMGTAISENRYLIWFPHGPVEVNFEVSNVPFRVYNNRTPGSVDTIVIYVSYNRSRNTDEEINVLKGEIITIAEKCVQDHRKNLGFERLEREDAT